MEKKPEQIHPDGWLKDLPVQAQSEGFKPEEMISCPKCERASAPNRLKCFYCNADLPINDVGLVKPNLRKLEAWEKGFNVICLPPGDQNSDEVRAPEVARFLGLELEHCRKILQTEKPLPIVRVESKTEAGIIVDRLKGAGVESFVLEDEKLKVETAPRRLRGVEFFDDKLVLILFNTDEVVEVSRENLKLIVSGALFVKKIESLEQHKRKEENKILATTELSSDEILIDFYTGADVLGYRVESKGFDFSCLGSEKQLLVKENMKRLFEKFRSFSPEAKCDEGYLRHRAEISSVWEVGQSKDSTGWQKKGFGKVNLASVTTVDNLSQFTKYSRLQWHLL